MSVRYIDILKRAYHATLRHPALWLLGLFLAGGFNANFAYWLNLQLRWRRSGDLVLAWITRNLHQTDIVFVGLIGLCLLGLVIIVVNWAKVIFVLRASDALNLTRMRSKTATEPSLKTSIGESPRYVTQVVLMSVFTVVSTVVVITALSSGAKLLFDSQGLVWFVAALLFLAFVLFFSCLNIFATFYIIFYRQHFTVALNLALDLIVSRGRIIYEMAALLLLIYGLGFFAGSSLLVLLRGLVLFAVLPLVERNMITPSLVFGLITTFSTILLWVWLAIINTFFNLSLLLLFTELVRPSSHSEAEPERNRPPLLVPDPTS